MWITSAASLYECYTAFYMKQRYVLVALVIAVAAAGAFWWFGMNGRDAERSAPALITAEFSNAGTGQSISVSFDNQAETATMTGQGYTGLVFRQTISASGARYENTAEGLILWNKGDDITLYRGDDVLFEGSTP